MSESDVVEPLPVAAVDLGSNSFHMIIARLVNGEPQIVDRMREQVMLATGFDKDDNIVPAAQERALECLRRFGERLRTIPHDRVRVVGTNTLRKASNSAELVQRAGEALGHPVEIISGREEARILYVGVAMGLGADERRRLVIDIGGGSTECIIGQGRTPLHPESMHMGCVGYTLRYFPGGRIDMKGFRAATTAARVELEPIERRYRSLGWDQAVGSSGTINAIEQVLRANGWGEQITRDGLRRLRKELVARREIANLAEIPGLAPGRALVFPGGVAILYGAFRSLRIESMTASASALREGLIYELIGRIQHEDGREHTVQNLVERFRIDAEQAARVERTAIECLEQVGGAWDLHDQSLRRYLRWAALLHEVGLVVTYSGYQRHGAYLIANSDLPGFSRGAQAFLAALVGAQRRRIRRETLDALAAGAGAQGLRLAVLLRLAVALNRRRSPEPLPDFSLIADGSTIELRFSEGWLEEHPMTSADLEVERDYLAAAGVTLRVT